MRSKRIILRTIINQKRDEANQILKEVEKLEYCLERMYCGCMRLDCVEHGSYDPNEIALVERYLTFPQTP